MMMVVPIIIITIRIYKNDDDHDVGDDFWHHPVPSPSWTDSDCSTGQSSALPRRAEADPCTVRWQQGAAHGES